MEKPSGPFSAMRTSWPAGERRTGGRRGPELVDAVAHGQRGDAAVDLVLWVFQVEQGNIALLEDGRAE